MNTLKTPALVSGHGSNRFDGNNSLSSLGFAYPVEWTPQSTVWRLSVNPDFYPLDKLTPDANFHEPISEEKVNYLVSDA